MLPFSGLALLYYPVKLLDLLEEELHHVLHLHYHLLGLQVVVGPDDVFSEDGLGDLGADHGEVNHEHHVENGALGGHELAGGLETQEAILLFDLFGLALLHELNRDSREVIVDRVGLEHQKVSVLNAQLQASNVLHRKHALEGKVLNQKLIFGQGLLLDVGEGVVLLLTGEVQRLLGDGLQRFVVELAQGLFVQREPAGVLPVFQRIAFYDSDHVLLLRAGVSGALFGHGLLDGEDVGLDEHADGVLNGPLHQLVPQLRLALVAGSEVAGLVLVYLRKQMLDLGDPNGREERVVHRFDEYGVLPENFALLEGQDGHSGVGKFLALEDAADVLEGRKLLADSLISRQF